jgi:DHA3 family macrolide efflux protein-like MFS transporter
MENSNNKWAVRFFILWMGQALSLLSSQVVQFAIIWYLTKTTNSATVLAIASMMGLLPQVLLSPFIGTWVDRGNRRLILMLAEGADAFVTIGLAVLFALGSVQVWQIFIVLFIRAIASGFCQSAFGASVVLLVPRNQLARVQGFNQVLYGFVSIVSAPLGAFLLAVLPMQGILGIYIVTALITIGIVFFSHIPQPERGESAVFTFWQDFAAGYRYIITWRGLVILLVLVMVINFFYSAIEPLTPLLITDHFNGGAVQFGLWLSLFAVGTLAGGIILGVWGGFKRKIITALTGLILVGLLTIGIGLIPSNLFIAGLIINMSIGLCLSIINGSINATLQASIAPDIQVRVFAFIQSAAMLVSPLALIIAGPFADRFGVQPWFVITGFCCALMGIAGFFFPDVMEIESKPKEKILNVSAEPS